MPPKRHAPQFQLPLYVVEADLPYPPRRVLPVVTGKRGEHQHLRRLHLSRNVARRRRLLSTLRRGGRGGRVVSVGRVQVDLGASGHQLAFPLHGPAGRHLAHHAYGHVQHQPRLGIVRFAKSDHLGVQLGTHLPGQQIRPPDIGRLPEVHETVRDEFFRRLGAREETLDGAPPVERVAALRKRRDVLKRDRILLRGGQHLLAQASGPRVQTGSPVALPVRPSALPRTIEAGTVVTALVRLLRLGQRRCVAALVVPATDHLFGHVARPHHQPVRWWGLLVVVERHSSMGQRTSRLCARRLCCSQLCLAALAFPPHGDLARVI